MLHQIICSMKVLPTAGRWQFERAAFNMDSSIALYLGVGQKME